MGSLLQQIAERARPFFRYHLLLPVALSVAAVVGACESQSAVTTVPTQLKCQVALAAPSSSIGPDGGMGTVTITAAPECPWDVSTVANWLSGLSPTSGQGTSTVEFRVAPNPLPSSREGEIVVNDNRVRVSQQAAPCRFELRPDSLTIDAKGGTREVAVSTLSACSWTIATDANWISFATRATGSGAETVRVIIAPNPEDELRTGWIILGNQRSTVTQAGAGGPEVPAVPGFQDARVPGVPGVPGAACTYSISQTGFSIAAAGGTGTVTVSAGIGCTWTASSSAAWVTVTSGASGSGNGPVSFSVAVNTSGARSGTLTIAGQTFTVTQAVASVCLYSISPTSSPIAATGGTGTVAVSASGSGCTWTASSSAGWVDVTSGATGSGNGSVGFSVAANTGGARAGTLTIAGQAFTVTQAAASVSCTYSISPTSSPIAATGGTGTVAVSTGSGCTWTASSSAGWVDVTSGATGSGNGSVGFSVAANTGGARAGTLTIAGQTFTVTQAAAAVSCTYSISPTSSPIAAAGGTGTVAVSTGTGCTWTASSSAGWVGVTSGAIGSGNGSVGFSVAANTGGARAGTLTIAGQTFTVTQAAAAVSCTYSISPTSSPIAATGGTGTVAVSTGSGCTWTASSSAGWVGVTSGATGSGNGSVGFSVAANTGGARSGTLTIAGQSFTVSQAAAPVQPPAPVVPCTYSISPTSVSINGSATGTVAVSTGSGCAWTASSQDNWITVTSGASGTGSGSVTYSAAAPPGKNDRTGKVTIAGHTFTVMQENKD